jgi:hypothetical protein
MHRLEVHEVGDALAAGAKRYWTRYSPTTASRRKVEIYIPMITKLSFGRGGPKSVPRATFRESIDLGLSWDLPSPFQRRSLWQS